MAEDGHSSSAWETTDHSDLNSSSFPLHGRSQPPPPVLETVEDQPPIPPIIPSKSVSPPPRSSLDSASRWHDNIPVTVEHRDTTISSIPGDPTGLVETTFDESILRALCDLDVSIPVAFELMRLPLHNLCGICQVRSPVAAGSDKTEHDIM